jgi:UDP-N-acetylglucosamine diphosphorylase / glucose-1-phosphate thymidylyltransferase / UDP-N-acetylgalactosamine diphosphorylase / glucosamine-1-phosphate N-acetyltransferase / galactosamine-1-phosphate N-acetyltransferase
MQVILLAAGQSTRLDPISDKNTLEFAGKTLLEHQISALKQAKMRDIAVVANKFNIDKIKTILKKYNNIFVVEQKKLEDGMAGGVLAGAEVIKHKNILVMSSNDVFDKSLFDEIIQTSKTKGVDGVIAGKRMDEYFPGGYLKVEKNGMITDIVEKPGAGKEPSKFVNLVCHVYNDFPKFLDYIKKAKTKKDDKYEVALDQYIKKGKAKIMLQKYTGLWQPLKYPWDILKLMNHYLKNVEHKIDRSASIAKTAIISGNVYVGPNAKIFDYAVIHGPAYIGEGSVVATNSMVRESMIGSNCVIGFSTEVARSYLNCDVWCHSNYIGDSIIDHNVSFGAGAVLGNLRFDEKKVKVNIKNERIESHTNKLGAIIGNGTRIGINSCTNPGIKIGKNCFIGGGMYVDKDVPDDKLVLLEQKIKITKNEHSVNMGDRKEMKRKLERK